MVSERIGNTVPARCEETSKSLNAAKRDVSGAFALNRKSLHASKAATCSLLSNLCGHVLLWSCFPEKTVAAVHNKK